MTKQEFHAVYTQFDGTKGAGEGTASVIANSEAGDVYKRQIQLFLT